MNNAELRTLIHQFDTGCLNAIEFLLKVQVSPTAVQNLLLASKLPAAAQVNLDIGDLMQSDDEKIELQDTTGDQARLTVASKILGKLAAADAIEDDYVVEDANFSFYVAAEDMGITARSDIMDQIGKLLIREKRPCTNELNRVWTDKESFIDLFGPLPKDFAPNLYDDDKRPFSEQKDLKIEYAKELLDWLAIQHTSARLRSFKFFRFANEFGVGIYTSNTSIRSSLLASLKQAKLPFTETNKDTIWISAEVFTLASNLRPPSGMTFERASK